MRKNDAQSLYEAAPAPCLGDLGSPVAHRSELEENLKRVLGVKAREMRCQALAIGGNYDHMHCLARFPPTVAVADIVGGLKGASSPWVNHEWRPCTTFKWQGSYGAFAVSENDLPNVEAYVRRQREHHANRELWEDWEQCSTPDVGEVAGDC